MTRKDDKKLENKLFAVGLIGCGCLVLGYFVAGSRLVELLAIPLFVWSIALSFQPSVRRTYQAQRARVGSIMGILVAIFITFVVR